MPVSDTLASLAQELEAMPPRARRAILRSLTSAEREMLATRAQDGAVSPHESATDADRFSPWLALLVQQARTGMEGQEAARMTAASRQLLVRSADAISGSAQPPGTHQLPGRSLFDAMGGFLSQRRAKP